MASFISGSENVSPVYAIRDNFDLPTKINEGKALGPQGVKTDLVQKLALNSLPSGDMAPAPRQKSAERVTAKDKPGLKALPPAPAPVPKKEAVTAPVQFANVYRNTQGFASVA